MSADALAVAYLFEDEALGDARDHASRFAFARSRGRGATVAIGTPGEATAVRLCHGMRGHAGLRAYVGLIDARCVRSTGVYSIKDVSRR